MSDRLQFTHVSGNINYLDIGVEEERYYILTDHEVRKWQAMSQERRSKFLAQKRADGEYKLKQIRDKIKVVTSNGNYRRSYGSKE